MEKTQRKLLGDKNDALLCQLIVDTFKPQIFPQVSPKWLFTFKEALNNFLISIESPLYIHKSPEEKAAFLDEVIEAGLNKNTEERV